MLVATGCGDPLFGVDDLGLTSFRVHARAELPLDQVDHDLRAELLWRRDGDWHGVDDDDLVTDTAWGGGDPRQLELLVAGIPPDRFQLDAEELTGRLAVSAIILYRDLDDNQRWTGEDVDSLAARADNYAVLYTPGGLHGPSLSRRVSPGYHLIWAPACPDELAGHIVEFSSRLPPDQVVLQPDTDLPEPAPYCDVSGDNPDGDGPCEELHEAASYAPEDEREHRSMRAELCDHCTFLAAEVDEADPVDEDLEGDLADCNECEELFDQALEADGDERDTLLAEAELCYFDTVDDH